MTKRYFLMAMLLGAAAIATAQDTYLNDRLTATDDVIGTARYVGMGGAMGALGADLSVISSNPAGIALYRKSDVALTFGAIVPNNSNGWNCGDTRTYGEKLARASFDQMGFIWSLKTGGDKLKHVNFGMNFQKKANYNMGFYADNMNLGGLSQMDQVAELVTNNFYSDNIVNLASLARIPCEKDETMDDYYLLQGEDGVYRNVFDSYENAYSRHQTGYNGSYDFNVSFNINERVYLGGTLGLDNIRYKSWSEYGEWGADGGVNHTLYNERDISGHGVNAKFGVIVRPISESPFRFGLTVETPTWYALDSYTYFHLDKSDEVSNNPTLEYNLRTPWRTRLSLGSTVDKILAWGIEYEFANTSKTSMGYPTGYSYNNSYSNEKDVFMNELTTNRLRGQHILRLGMEVKPIDPIAIRVGYNYVSSRYKDNPSFDQYHLAYGDGSGKYYSYAMDYQTSTDYMTLGAANIVTFGLGFKYKKFYADIAYKYRVQNAKFYAFDSGFTAPDGQFAQDYPELTNTAIEPVNVDLNRHQLMLTAGFKF